MSKRYEGIDISEIQNPKHISYSTLAENVDFAILRVGGSFQGSQGRFYKDAHFETHYLELNARGVLLGAYWYSVAATEEQGRAEAREMIKHLKGKKFEYPIVVDAEWKTSKTAGIVGFLDELEKQGYYAMFYTYHYFFQGLDKKKLEKYDFWIADYRGSADPGRSFGIWQYSETGRVPGYNGNLDMNYAYRDYPERIRSRGLNGLTDNSKPEVKPSEPDKPHIYDKPTILAKHANEVLIAHLASITPFKKGDVVQPGQILGRMGNTGVSNGIHGHVCVYEMETPYIPWMSEQHKFKASPKATRDFISKPGFMVDASTKKPRVMEITNGWDKSGDGLPTYAGHHGYDVIAKGSGVPYFAWPLDVPGIVTSVHNFGGSRYGQILMIKWDRTAKPFVPGIPAEIRRNPAIRVFIRTTPDLDGKQVGYLEPGTKINLLEENGSIEVRDSRQMIWYKIGNNQYVKHDFVTLL